MKKLTIFMVIVDILVAICFYVVYFVDDFKNMIIATSLTTKTHQYIAYTFYSPIDIHNVMAMDSYIPFTDEVNLDDIVIDTSEKDSYDNEYDEIILTRDPGNDDYKIINVKVGKYDGFLAAIYDPSKVRLIHSQKFNANNTGWEPILSMCRRYGGLVCINGGGFSDPYGYGSDIPNGYIIKDGRVIWSTTSEPGNLIGFTNDNKLLLVTATGDEAIAMGMRDAVEFGPFLIVNGKTLQFANSQNVGGYVRAARTVIAQRRDGVVLFLVTNGTHTNGPNTGEIIETLVKYGAYNAAYMDGGSSTTMVANNRLINTPLNNRGQLINGGVGRYVVNGWGLIP